MNWSIKIGIVLSFSTVVGAVDVPVYADSNLPLADSSVDVRPSVISAWAEENLTDEDFRESYEIGLNLEIRDGYLLVNGIVDERSFDQFYELLNTRSKAIDQTREEGIKVLIFTTVPGSADDETNLDLGCLIRLRQLVTFLPARGMIASGGTDLFLAGKRRIVERGAKIGVHSWSSGFFGRRNASRLPKDHRDHSKYLNYYRNIEISVDFYWFTLEAAPPGDIHWMTHKEQLSYKVFTDLLP